MDVFATQAIEDATEFCEEANRHQEKHQVGILEKEGAVFPIYTGINKLGRDESCDICFNPEEISVSKFHAVIEAGDDDDTFYIYDTKSLNGTYLGKKRLPPEARYNIDEHSVLKLGNVFFTVRKCPVAKPEPIEISDDDSDIVLPEVEKEGEKTIAVEDDEPCTQFEAASPLPARAASPEPAATESTKLRVEEEPCTQFEESEIVAALPDENTQFEEEEVTPANKTSIVDLDTQECGIPTSAQSKKQDNIMNLETQAEALLSPSKQGDRSVLEMDTQAFVTPPNKKKTPQKVLEMETQAFTPPLKKKPAQNVLEMDTQAFITPPSKKKTAQNDILDMETQDFITPINKTPQILIDMENQTFSTPAASFNQKVAEVQTPAFSTPLGNNQSVLDMETQGDLVTSTSNQDILTEDTQASVFAVPKTPVSSKSSKVMSPMQKSTTQSNVSILEMDTQSQAEVIDSSILELETQASDSESSLNIRYIDTDDSLIEDSQKEIKKSTSNVLDIETQCDDNILNQTTQAGKDILNQSTQMVDDNENNDTLIINSSFDGSIQSKKRNNIFNLTTQSVEMNYSMPFTSEDEDDEIIQSTKREVSKIIEKGSQYTDSQATEFDESIVMDSQEPPIVPETQDVELEEEIIPDTQDTELAPQNIIAETQDDESAPQIIVAETQDDESAPQTVVAETQDDEDVNMISESQDIDEVIEDTPPSSPVPKRRSVLSLGHTPQLSAVIDDSQATQLAPKFFDDTQATQAAPKFTEDSEATQVAPKFDTNTAPTQRISQIETQLAPIFIDSEATQLAPTFPDSQTSQGFLRPTIPDTQPVSQIATQVAPKDSETQVAPTLPDSEATQVAPKFDENTADSLPAPSNITTNPQSHVAAEEGDDYFQNINDVETQVAPTFPDTLETQTAEEIPSTFSQIERRLAPMFADTQVEASEKEDSHEPSTAEDIPATFSQIERRLAPMFADTQVENTVATPVLKPTLREPSPGNRKSTGSKHVTFSSDSIDSIQKTLPKTPSKFIKTVRSVENIPVEKSLVYDDITSPLLPDKSSKQAENAQVKPSEVFDYEDSDEGEMPAMLASKLKRTQKRQSRPAKRTAGKSVISSATPSFEAIPSTSAQGLSEASTSGSAQAPQSRQSSRKKSKSSSRNRKSAAKQTEEEHITEQVPDKQPETEKTPPAAARSSRSKRATKKGKGPEKSSIIIQEELNKNADISESIKETGDAVAAAGRSATEAQQLEVEPQIVPETAKTSQRSRAKPQIVAEVKSSQKVTPEVAKKTETRKRGGERKEKADQSPERQEVAVSKPGIPQRSQAKQGKIPQQEQPSASKEAEDTAKISKKTQVKPSQVVASETVPLVAASPKRSKRMQARRDVTQLEENVPVVVPQTEKQGAQTMPGTPKRGQRSQAKPGQAQPVQEASNQHEVEENVAEPSTPQKVIEKLPATPKKNTAKQDEPGTSNQHQTNTSEEQEAPGTPKRSKRKKAQQNKTQTLETAVEAPTVTSRTPSKNRSRSANTDNKAKSEVKQDKAQAPEAAIDLQAVEAPAVNSRAASKNRSRSARTETKGKSHAKQGNTEAPEVAIDLKAVEAPTVTSRTPSKSRSRAASTETKRKSHTKQDNTEAPEAAIDLQAVEAPAVNSRTTSKNRSRSVSTETKGKSHTKQGNTEAPEVAIDLQAVEAPTVTSQTPSKSRSRSVSTETKGKSHAKQDKAQAPEAAIDLQAVEAPAANSRTASKNRSRSASTETKGKSHTKQDNTEAPEVAIDLKAVEAPAANSRTTSKNRSRSARTETKGKSHAKQDNTEAPEADIDLKAVEAPAASSRAPSKSRSRSARTETKGKSHAKQDNTEAPEAAIDLKAVEAPAANSQTASKNRSRSASTETKGMSHTKQDMTHAPEAAVETPAASSRTSNKNRSRSTSTETKAKKDKSAANISHPQVIEDIHTENEGSERESQPNGPLKTLPKRKAKTNHALIKPVTDPVLPRLNLVIVRESGSGQLKSHLKSPEILMAPPAADVAIETTTEKLDTQVPEGSKIQRGASKQVDEKSIAGASHEVGTNRTKTCARRSTGFVKPAAVEKEEPEPSTSLAKNRSKRKVNENENEPPAKRTIQNSGNVSISVDDENAHGRTKKRAGVQDNARAKRSKRSSVSPAGSTASTEGPRKGRETKKPAERSKRSSVSPADSIVSTRSAGRASSSSASPEKGRVNNQSDQEHSFSSVMTNDSTMTHRSMKRGDKSKTLVMFTGFNIGLDKHEQIIKQLGGHVVEKVTERECILVVKNVQRTLKLLTMLARGLPIVPEKWFSDCKKAGRFLDPWKYLLKDKAFEAKYGFDLQTCLEKRKQGEPVFKGYTIMATPNIKPTPHELKGVVENAGATFLFERPKVWPKPSLLVTCDEDSDLWNNLRYDDCKKKHKPRLVKVAAIWESIQQQEVNFKNNEYTVERLA